MSLDFYTHQNIERLKSQIRQGDVLSTDLELDHPPSQSKMIILSLATFGIYYLVYHLKHDPDRVFKQMKSDLEKIAQQKNRELNMSISRLSPEDVENLKTLKIALSTAPQDLHLSFFTALSNEKVKAIASRFYKNLFEKTILEENVTLNFLKDQLSLDPNEENLSLQESKKRLLIQQANPSKYELKVDIDAEKGQITLTGSQAVREKKSIPAQIFHFILSDDDGPPEKHYDLKISTVVDVPISRDEFDEIITTALQEEEKVTLENVEKRKDEALNDFQRTLQDVNALMSVIWKNKDTQKRIDEVEALKNIESNFLNQINSGIK